MKYLLSFFLFLFAFSLQSLQAATQIAAVSESILDRLTIPVDTLNSPQVVGIGRMASIGSERSPIQFLASISRPSAAAASAQARARSQSAEGRMGARLVSVMDEAMASTGTTVAIDDDPTLAISTDIIDTDTDANAGSLQEGRMYTPKLKVDFQKFPIPTYATMSAEVRQKRMGKLNDQVQKRFGETVQIVYSENVHYLRGTVSSERQKEVLELFIKMEPGIQEIQNEIAVKL